MIREKKFILWFKEIGIEDVPFVGGKNAALGEMYQNLVPLGINVPDGFALTSAAYAFFIKGAGLDKRIKEILTGLDTHNIRDLQTRGKKVRQVILDAELPTELKQEVAQAYAELGKKYGKNLDVAVRSSATAEDLPGSSFAGQQETYLNIVGEEALLQAVKKCIASLFTNRAISYRVDKGFSHFEVALSVGVQKMARSDLASSGVAFTIDTETGFKDVVIINGSYGLGEMIVQGKVTPDEFIIWKPGLKQGHRAIIGKTLGDKKIKLVYGSEGTVEAKVSEEEKSRMCLTDAEAEKLAEWCVKIEEHFSVARNRTRPMDPVRDREGSQRPSVSNGMDIEWAKDGKSGKLFIVQARPETVHASADKNVYKEYRLRGKGKVLVSGTAVGTKIAVGKVKVIKNAKNIESFGRGEVLVTEITDPDWEPIMKIASAIVTDKGGRTSHAAIVSRELGIPCIVGTANATRVLRSGRMVTVDCSSGEVGKVYDGAIHFEEIVHRLDKIPETKTKVMVNIGSPDEAFARHYLPAKGVGLGRLEFIIASHIRIHPNALLN